MSRVSVRDSRDCARDDAPGAFGPAPPGADIAVCSGKCRSVEGALEVGDGGDGRDVVEELDDELAGDEAEELLPSGAMILEVIVLADERAGRARKDERVVEEPVERIDVTREHRGTEGDALEILAELENRAVSEPIPPLALASVHYGLGDLDAFFTTLDKSIAARDLWLIQLNVDPGFAAVRSDPRFKAAVARIVPEQ